MNSCPYVGSHVLLWFFQRVTNNMSIKYILIIETFCRFSLDVWPEKVESNVSLLTVNLSALEFCCVFKVESDHWYAVASYFQSDPLNCLCLYDGRGNLGKFLQPFRLTSPYFLWIFPFSLRTWNNRHHIFKASKLQPSSFSFVLLLLTWHFKIHSSNLNFFLQAFSVSLLE